MSPWRAGPTHLDVHLVLDNSSTHKTPSIQRWLVPHPRFTLHVTPTYSSWLNLVERWFAELTTSASRLASMVIVRQTKSRREHRDRTTTRGTSAPEGSEQ
jgi:transposase